jgi:cysteine desulfuration protein SufE
MTLTDTQKYLAETAEVLMSFSNRRDMLEVLVDMGKELPDFPHELRISQNSIKGCASEVWVVVTLGDDSRICIQAGAEALIVRGFIKILVDALSGLLVSDLEYSQPLVKDFVQKTEIAQSMLASRANAFGNIYQSILQRSFELFSIS